MSADLIITNAMPWKHPGATALAVRAGRIIAIGRDDEVTALAGPATLRVDGCGASLLPGFQDAHAHPPMGGLALNRCDVTTATTRTEVAARLRAYASGLADGDWLLGSGWEPLVMGPELDRGFLDQLIPDRPVYLVSAGRHDGWMNSEGLRRVGLTDDSPDPAHGRIGRRTDGSLSGVLHEAAQIRAEALLPPVTRRDYEQALLAAERQMLAHGITAWQDAWTTPDVHDAYVDLAHREELAVRVQAALWWERDEGIEQIDRLIELRRQADIGPLRLRASTVKIMVDGTTGNQSAAVFEPYVDPRTGCDCGNGGLFVPVELLKEAVCELDAVGFGVHFHAIGERAVHEALNAVAVARAANGRTPGRHHIAHLCLVHPDDIPRFAGLDVTANLQPLWASDNPEVAEESLWVGPERAQWWYPFGSLRRAGTRLCAGSDWPVSSLDPLEGSYVGVHRLDPGTGQPDQQVFLPEQRLTVTEMIDAYTAGSAYVNGLDGLTGRIGVGMLADLVLLDRDLLTAEHDPQTLGRVRLTVIDGRSVFDPENLVR